MSEQRIVINGGRELYGNVTVHGAKNAVLPLLAAGLLTDEDLIIDDCPYITDIDHMVQLLDDLGATVLCEGRRITVRGSAKRTRASEVLYKTMRSSMFMLGAVLSVTGEVEISLPGGCDIGARPLDIHLDGLRKMGAITECIGDSVRCKAEKLHGATVIMRYPSVGATENLLMCAALAVGETTLINCAREPEIVTLVRALKAMGAKISGEGSSVIHIEGVDKLGGAVVKADGDRIVAGTVLSAVALCGGEVRVFGANADDMRSVIQTLRSDCCQIDEDGVSVRVRSNGRVRAKSIITAPYPLFPTDMQPQFTACQCFSDGVSRIEETVFENRLNHIYELIKMGAHISACSDCATILGSERGLKPATLIASDLRGGAGLSIAAMKVEGESTILNPHFIDRGYEDFDGMFRALGADIKRV